MYFYFFSLSVTDRCVDFLIENFVTKKQRSVQELFLSEQHSRHTKVYCFHLFEALTVLNIEMISSYNTDQKLNQCEIEPSKTRIYLFHHHKNTIKFRQDVHWIECGHNHRFNFVNGSIEGKENLSQLILTGFEYNTYLKNILVKLNDKRDHSKNNSMDKMFQFHCLYEWTMLIDRRVANHRFDRISIDDR